MRKEQMEQIERWANFVKNNDNWKGVHTKFINSQFKKHKEFIKRILKKPNGKAILLKLYNKKLLK